MKLKKLEITGFKSFVDKTSISFPQGVSAIVGPNGCGKSNLFDALRWVMGEQSVKQLRGKSMEDVIFAGTNGRPPLNMAEVSLTLINDNGSVPEEFRAFSEIMITRRLHRSGERSYFLNKQPCRLKDINNILMGSGLGAKSYAIIQQGNIGAITDAGPEERRFFIEEAAGVTRYKTRKEEALRKVKETRENLLRVSDIIAEIKRQMEGLNRQAKKAELYKKFRARMKEIDVLHSLVEYHEHQKELDESGKLIKELKNLEFEHAAQLSQLDAMIEEIKIKRAEKNREISEKKSLKFELQRDTDKMENELAHLRKELERLAVETRELESACKDLDEKNRTIEKEMGEVEKENSDLEAEIKRKKGDLDAELRLSEDLREKLTQGNRELESHKSELMNLVANEAKYKNIYQNVSNNKESLTRRLKRIAEEEVIAGEKVRSLENKEGQAKEAVIELKRMVEETETSIAEVRGKLVETGKELGQKVKQVQTLELERNKVRSRYHALKKMDDNFEWYKDGVRAIMKINDPQSQDQPDTPAHAWKKENILCIMADTVDPEPGFETAVEAVLGESLQYILVKDQDTGLKAVEYLKANEAGRGGFIPVSPVKLNGGPSPEPANPAHLFPLPLLLDHVSVKEGFEGITQTLLGNVMVADEFLQAVDVWNRLNETNGKHPMAIVTKDGGVISSNGVLLGGSRDKLSGILEKKQEIKELERQVARLDSQIETGRSEQKAIEASVREFEIDLQKSTEEKNSLKQDEIEAEKNLYKATEELKHARRHSEIVSLEHEQLLGEESEIDDDMAKYHKVLLEVEQEVKSAQEKVAQTSEKIASMTVDIDAYNQKTVDIKLSLTSLAAKHDNSNNTLRRLKHFHADGVNRLEQLTLDIERKIQRKAESTNKIDDYSQKLNTIYETFKSLEQDLESNEEVYQAIEARLKEKDDLISTLQSEREKNLEKFRYLEVEQSQRQIKLENIASRLEERYHTPFHQLEPEFSDQFKSLTMSKDEMAQELATLREKIQRIGDVNLGAIEEYEENKTRYDFLNTQKEDLEKALEDLQEVIRKTNKITKELFLKTLEEINVKLGEVFPRLFNGGTARLELTDPNEPLESGVEFMIHPPGKKLTRMSLLSGGEKALSAISFIFAIFLLKPASFCLMDEIDAPLDEANVFRFNDLLKIIGEKSQIIMVTHNKSSMEFADQLLGVTMEKKGVSQIVSVNLN